MKTLFYKQSKKQGYKGRSISTKIEDRLNIKLLYRLKYEHFERGDTAFFYLKKDDVMVAELIGSIENPERGIIKLGYIINHYEKARDKGFGSLLMKRFLKYCKRKGYKEIIGDLTEHHLLENGDRLRHFYIKFGFDVKLNNDGKTGTIKLSI